MEKMDKACFTCKASSLVFTLWSRSPSKAVQKTSDQNFKQMVLVQRLEPDIKSCCKTDAGPGLFGISNKKLAPRN